MHRHRAWLRRMASTVALVVVGAHGCVTPPPEPPKVTVAPPPPVCPPPPPDNFSGLFLAVGSPEDDLRPVVSQDGKRMGFVRAPGSFVSGARTRNLDVFYINLEEPRYNPIQVTRHDSAEAFPSWNPSATELYYGSNRLRVLTIWRTAVAGLRGDIQITGRDADDFAPSVSPDGRRIAFNTFPTSPTRSLAGGQSVPFIDRAYVPSPAAPAPSIWIANADGTLLTQIAVSGYHPTWTPDGRRIIFYASNGVNFDIWMMNPDGSERTQLTNDPGDEIEPALSPDMGTLVYAAYDRVKRNFDLWAVNLRETGGQTQLTFDCEDDRAPAWAPDGTLFFMTLRNAK